MKLNMAAFNVGAHAVVNKDIPEEVEELRHALTDAIFDEEEALTPVRTGRLVKGWRKEKSKGPWAVDRTGNEEFYSRFVNDGTSKRRGVRMREIAVDKVLARYGGSSE